MGARRRGWEVVDRVRAGDLLVFDGGYGTALFAAGLLNGACPELWNDTHPEICGESTRGTSTPARTSSRRTPSAELASSSTSTPSVTGHES